jgi:hypothetical protein
MKFENVKVLNCTSPTLTNREYDMFCWGRVKDIHKIGEYEIIEYLDLKMVGCTITREVADNIQFHINGASCCADTLDKALITAIANKHNNRHAIDFICKGLGI